MARIATLTLNPAIDGACDAEKVRPTHKVRTGRERFDAGGGGINVARVIKRLGGDTLAVYLAGGATGAVLDSILDGMGLARRTIAIADDTRISLAVHERETGLEYRFVPEGPDITAAEQQACLDAVKEVECDYFVASGSLPPSVATDFYVRIHDVMAERGIPFILDTSGEPLRAAMERGGLFLVKPSINELEQIVGKPLRTHEAQNEAAAAIVEKGQVQNLAVTLGHEGALLATAEGLSRLPAIKVEAKSAVGAGDSFLAAMVYAISEGYEMRDAFRMGVAAGTAAVLAPGTGLCDPNDVQRFYVQLKDMEKTAPLPD